jgi:uncharacterized membrane protein
MDRLLSVIEAILKHPATVKTSLADLAEKDLRIVLKFCVLVLVVRVVPKVSVALTAYLVWHLAHGGSV